MNGGLSARIIAIGLIGVSMIFSACNEGSSSPAASSGTTEAGSRPARRTYLQALYSVKIPADWVLAINDEETGIYLESIWRDPSDPRSSILIEAEAPAPHGRPTSRAESVRARTSRSAGYREIAFEPISLGGRPGVRWVFDLSGDRRVGYFVNMCEVGIMVRGSAPPANFNSLAETFRKVASSVTVRCT